MIRCALCGRDGERGYETMPASTLERGRGLIGGIVIDLPAASIVQVYVCAARAACRRRRGLRP